MLATKAGLARHGVKCEIASSVKSLTGRHDLVVTWGSQGWKADRPHLILEAGYINGSSGDYVSDRLRFVSTSWNQPHGMSDGFEIDCEADRWERLGIELKEWRANGSYVLMLGQHPGDYASPSQNIWDSVRDTLRAANYDVIERPHPLVAETITTLEDQLNWAMHAVTWASTAAVEAILSGTPVYALHPMCIASPVSSGSLNDPVITPNREQWAYNLAYRQWTLDEIASGDMWEFTYGRAFPTQGRTSAQDDDD